MLSNLEDHFIKAVSIFKKLDSGTFSVDWDYQDTDAANFKEVAFDYMRAKYEGKEFRDHLLGGSNRVDGVFLKEKEWQEFYTKHCEIINNATLENEEDYKMIVSQLKCNLRHTRRKLESHIDENNISSIINSIITKIDNLENLIEQQSTVDENNIQNLKKIEQRLYCIRKGFD